MSNGPKLFTEEDAAAIRNLGDIMCQALVDQDLDAYLDRCTEDVNHIPPGQPVFVGKDVYRSHLETVPRATTYTYKLDEISGNGDLAYSFGMVTFKYENADDYSPRVIVIYRRDSEGAWKMARDIWNTEIPLTP